LKFKKKQLEGKQGAGRARIVPGRKQPRGAVKRGIGDGEKKDIHRLSTGCTQVINRVKRAIF